MTVGDGESMVYATQLLEAMSDPGGWITLRASGRNITKAVDIAVIARKRLGAEEELVKFTMGGIRTSSAQVEVEGVRRYVSTIEIDMRRDWLV